MSHVADFFTNTIGAGYSFVLVILFAAMSVFGLIVAFRGKQTMVWLVGLCAFIVGLLGGAMAGLFIFNKLIIMIVMGIAGGIILSLLVKFVKGIGYFIGICALGFFLAFVITSEMYITDTKITEDTMLLFDIVVGVIMGFLAIIHSKHVTVFITAASGGLLAAIGLMASFGYYFSDWKLWLLALAISTAGALFQLKSSDDSQPKKKVNAKHNKKR